METLKHILKKYKIDKTEDKIFLKIGRYKDIPKLFTELGFKKGVEIGVLDGAYSRELFKLIPGLYLIGVDPWESYSGYKDFRKDRIAQAYESAKEIYKGKNGKIIRGYSNDKKILDSIPDESLDFVYIDGNHAYEYVVADIANWSKKVRKGGVVAGHDYDDFSGTSRRYLMNVINAVDGWCKSYEISPLFIATNNRGATWFYVK